ncbi:MAG: tetratricopeptide repeat protein [Myxococcota bacterium]
MRLALAALLLVSCVGPKRAERAASRVDLGAAYYREGNPEAAITTLREAVKMDPRNWRARNTLAVAYIAKQEPELAEEAFEGALRLNPDEAEILVNYGAFQLKAGRVDEAIATFEKALKDLDYRNPPLIQSNLALAMLQANRLDEALAYAREAVRRQPLLCEGWFHVGLVQERRKDQPAALEAYRKLVETCPNEGVGARLRTGCIQVEVGMAEEGVAELRRVISEAPNTPLADEARVCLRSLEQ